MAFSLMCISACFLLIYGQGCTSIPDVSSCNDFGDIPYGIHLQRTMTLLATSSPTHRHTVKILCYGQSIVGQGYVDRRLSRELSERFPDADVIIENRAIGGYEAPRIARTIVHDVYPAYPDLVIFHVYNGHVTGELETIIADIRRHTTAEILLWTHHLDHYGPDGTERDPLREENSRVIVCLARKYGCELVDVRREWAAYLKANHLDRQALLADSIHLNERGGELLADLVCRHFRYLPGSTADFSDQVRTFSWDEKNSPIVFKNAMRMLSERCVVGNDPNGPMELTFDGNRVELIAMRIPQQTGTATILIDGQPPSRIPQAYAATRPSPTDISWFPAINRIGLGGCPIAEDWTLTFTKANSAADEYEFDLVGSVTGPDGHGTHAVPFVSRSGRIGIDPIDVMLAKSQSVAQKQLSIPLQVKWTVELMGMDIWRESENPDRNRYLLIQGIANGKHTLQIIPNGDGPIPVLGITVYRPPLSNPH